MSVFLVFKIDEVKFMSKKNIKGNRADKDVKDFF